MKKVLNSEAVKIIALVTMLIDHIGYIMYGHIDTGVYNVLRGIGRISFPLFAFLIAEGFFYTKDEKKYLLRIMSFAFISEIPFNMNTERKRGGRIPKLNPKSHHVMLRFDDDEWMKFLVMYEQTNVKAKAVFAKARIFGEPFKVLREDKTLVEYYTKLSSFHSQYRMIGNNYNQIVKELRCHFSEKKAMALLYKLENCTRELVSLTREIVELTRKFEERWSQR